MVRQLRGGQAAGGLRALTHGGGPRPRPRVMQARRTRCCCPPCPPPQPNITLLATCYYQANQANRAYTLLKAAGTAASQHVTDRPAVCAAPCPACVDPARMPRPPAPAQSGTQSCLAVCGQSLAPSKRGVDLAWPAAGLASHAARYLLALCCIKLGKLNDAREALTKFGELEVRERQLLSRGLSLRGQRGGHAKAAAAPAATQWPA